MAIIAKVTEGGGGDFERPAAGTYRAVCHSVHDIGIQRTVYQGKEKIQHKVVIVWEIDDEIKTGDFSGQRHVVTNRYTLSLHEKAALRKDLEAWRGKAFTEAELSGFDIEKVIGVPCMISLVTAEKDGKTYTNIAGVMAMPKGTQGIKSTLPADKRFKWIEKLKADGGHDVPTHDTGEYTDADFTKTGDGVPF